MGKRCLCELYFTYLRPRLTEPRGHCSRVRAAALLHVQFWKHLGPGPVGYAIGNLPIKSSRQGSGARDMFELAQQFYHRKLTNPFAP